MDTLSYIEPGFPTIDSREEAKRQRGNTSLGGEKEVGLKTGHQVRKYASASSRPGMS